MNATISFMNQFLPIGFLLLLLFILFSTQRKEPLLTPVFLPGEFHGQRSLAGWSAWDRKESDKTE